MLADLTGLTTISSHPCSERQINKQTEKQQKLKSKTEKKKQILKFEIATKRNEKKKRTAKIFTR